MIRKSLLVFFLLALISAACAPQEAPTKLVSISLPMGYIPDPQYAAYYVAADKGYFAEAGFEVEFDYSFETDGMALVGSGERPFAVVSGEQVLLARAQDLPVVYVLEWFQKYPIAVVSKSDANIAAPADLVGRNVGLPGFFGASYVGYVGLLLANGLAQEDVEATEIGFTQYETIKTDKTEAAVVYINNEPVRLAQDGEAINVIPVADYIDLVANGIVTNETMLAEHPEQVEGFVHALLQGLADTLADPSEAYEISKKYVEGLDDSRMTVLEASLPLWNAAQLGVTSADSWATTQEVLLEMGLLDTPLADLEAAYTNQFIETFGVVESVKAAGDMFAPSEGKVVEVNEEPIDTPEILNSDPYGIGWLIKLSIADASELDSLMDAEAYQAYCDERA